MGDHGFYDKDMRWAIGQSLEEIESTDKKDADLQRALQKSREEKEIEDKQNEELRRAILLSQQTFSEEIKNIETRRIIDVITSPDIQVKLKELAALVRKDSGELYWISELCRSVSADRRQKHSPPLPKTALAACVQLLAHAPRLRDQLMQYRYLEVAGLKNLNDCQRLVVDAIQDPTHLNLDHLNGFFRTNPSMDPKECLLELFRQELIHKNDIIGLVQMESEDVDENLFGPIDELRPPEHLLVVPTDVYKMEDIIRFDRKYHLLGYILGTINNFVYVPHVHVKTEEKYIRDVKMVVYEQEHPKKDEGKDPIIIVGAGPVGLYLAAKLLDQGKNVIIIEKREKDKTYLRQQQYFIDKKAFDYFPEEVQNTLLTKYTCQMFRPPRFAGAEICCTDMKLTEEGKDQASCGDRTIHTHWGVSDDTVSFGYSVKTDTLQIVFRDYIENKISDIIHYGMTMSEIDTQKSEIVYSDENDNKIRKKFSTLILASGNSSKDTKSPIIARPKGGADPILLSSKYIPIAVAEGGSPRPMYGAALSFRLINEKKLPIKTACPINKNAFNTTFLRQQHRFRLFRQQNDDVYVGINLTEDEFNKYNTLAKKLPTEKIEGEDLCKLVEENDEVIFNQLDGILFAFTGFGLDDYSLAGPSAFSIFPITLNQVNLKEDGGCFSTKDGRLVFFAGDAAINIHYFAAYGINMGLYGGNYIVEAICRPGGCLPQDINMYNHFIEDRRNIVKWRVDRIYDFKLTLKDEFKNMDMETVRRQVGSVSLLGIDRIARIPDFDIRLMHQHFFDLEEVWKFEDTKPKPKY